ncbi:GNAT family N-acetyltransferase [Ruegeria jejuensis]|uniref:GNAT family N-acetyltransferase n=1 Tax=Ruegeria jejuensis TaxID=3233338 RepID=UPI00355B46C9
MIEARALTSADVGLWRALRNEGAHLYPEAFIVSYEEAVAQPEELDVRLLDQGGRFAAFDGADPVGIAALRPEMFARCRHRGSIGPFYVTTAAQGGGAGSALMTALIDDAQAHGIWQLELSVAADNVRAIRFYESCGFKRQGCLPNAVILPDGAQDDLFFRLDLREAGCIAAHKT